MTVLDGRPVIVDDTDDDTSPLRSVAIAMAVLDCFGEEPELGATKVAQRLGVAKSTACRMLAALASGGLLERSGAGRYRLGLRLFEMGQLAVDRLMLREVALPVLGELRDVLRETAQLAVPVGADVLYVERLENSDVGIMFHTELYRRGPGHSSSAGKAMAAVNPAMARAILDRGFVRRTPFTIVDPGRYRQVLRQVQVDGFAVSREEHTIGMSSIAAPVVVTRGERRVAVAAISVVGRTASILGTRKMAVVQNVRRAAAAVSAELDRSMS
ncbi:MAG: IclR family transcriptional regulator [Pseudonocardia sp.]|uniref:IclR family transcriptional regulator n=1 Tax=unclassified Pseudonocardia TaxID=2619320 RepID=UPI000869BA10|nr:MULTISPECIES: IclR family transcriptional regulator [unclassified Pseudonocardia]MBN9107512.1 IclR family transcriptional regulator [Pseudonocardia sp.]ODV08369.1 MAG: IclR family transcriptional regulator [Pseudonocardia sp. SCN 73-27]